MNVTLHNSTNPRYITDRSYTIHLEQMNLCDVSKKKSSMYRLPNALIPIDLLDYSIYIKEWKLWNLAINFYNINQNYGVKLFSNACMSKLYTF